MKIKSKTSTIKSVSVALGALVLLNTGACAQYASDQAAHAADVRAIQARRDQHAANVAALYGDYAAADAYAHAAHVRRVQSYRDAGYAQRLRYWGY
ncbi:hypothetical protein MKK70_12330 [Methylobacterium sp. E-041]|uniref:hypothetical protein n=1 Tax=unclassified Methylobacterium TaxID=2615210 RepID=UPI001FB9746D|nr:MULTISPECIES: hypothetical protein [unclassified Methylobacterium]MCJ2037504.1 hypothetical protein [Methylobacterium sp. J-059]MCJ2106149.1 hypothetical protein [Methylobacterium sp. E-041]